LPRDALARLATRERRLDHNRLKRNRLQVNLMDASSARLTLFYDDTCPLCRRFKAAIEAWDSDCLIEVVDIAQAATQRRFRHLDLNAATQQLTVCDRLGNLHHGVECLRRLTQLLPGLRRLTWAYQLPGVTPVIGKLYRTVHRRRKKLCLKCGEKSLPSIRHRGRMGRH
jgi:predicted DCC family thiol-disulfide oxidoreductase YuxK